MKFKVLKMKSIVTFFIICSLVVWSCDEPIYLGLDQVESKMVIEGLVTSDDIQHYVKISQTKDFYEQGRTDRIANAQVTVEDDNGNVYTYIHNPQNKNSLEGYYFSETAFAGNVGSTYSMTVVVDGVTYTGQDKLMPVSAIDSLTWEVDPDEYQEYLEDIEEAINDNDAEWVEELLNYYAVFFHAREPQDRVDYYLFKFYRNGEEVRDFDTDIYFAEDTFVGETIDYLEIADYYALGDTVSAEMYSITRAGYIYYSDLFNVLNNDGGMFGPIPANPRNNLTNGALGFFQASAVDRKTIVITE